MGAEIVEFPVARGDAIVGMHVRDLGLPREALVNVIVRGGRAIPPRGSTRPVPRDVLHIMVTQDVIERHVPAAGAVAQRPMRARARARGEVWMTMPVYRARRPATSDGPRLARAPAPVLRAEVRRLAVAVGAEQAQVLQAVVVPVAVDVVEAERERALVPAGDAAVLAAVRFRPAARSRCLMFRFPWRIGRDRQLVEGHPLGRGRCAAR